MLSVSDAFSGFSTDDIERTRSFYRDVIGIEVVDGEMPGILELRFPGGHYVIVYEKPDHVPAVFTVLNLVVADVATAIAELAEAGLTPERYEGMPQDEDGAMRGNGPDIAWFTDPSGNIFSVLADA